jgi:hypothetical protein
MRRLSLLAIVLVVYGLGGFTRVGWGARDDRGNL